MPLGAIRATAQRTLEVFELSAKGDGSELNKLVVPIVFGRALVDPYHGFAQYTVQPRDTLSSIAQHFYGDAAHYPRRLGCIDGQCWGLKLKQRVCVSALYVTRGKWRRPGGGPMPSKSTTIGLALAGAVAAAVGVDRLAEHIIRRYEDLDVEQAELPGARVLLRGLPVHYVEQGRGFPVVLVHGFVGSTFSYRFLIPVLAERFRVLAVDLAGFGYSARDPSAEYTQPAWAEQLAEFLDPMGVQRAAFVGHSLGGAIVQRLAVNRPELVERLVLVDSPSAAEPPAVPVVIIGPLVRLLQAALVLSPPLVARINRRLAYDPAFLTAEVLEGYRQPLRAPGSSTVLHKMLKDARLERPAELDQLRVPTLLLRGAHDRLLKPEASERLHAAIAGSRLEVVQEAGHLPLEEQPGACNRLILDFLADLTSGTAAAAADAGKPS